MQGPAAVLLLGAMLSAAGLSVASWGFRRRPAEAALTAGTVAVALAYGVVHLLGWLEVLTPLSVPLTVVGVTVPIVAATVAVPRLRAGLRETAADVARFATEGVALPFRARSLTALGVLAVVFLTAWTAWLAYLAPSSAWDGVMYHEPMVGFALQNRGFAPVDLVDANRMLGPVDGYPRLSENLMLLAAVAWDRRLVDVIPSVFYPLTLVATYVLMRRFVRSRLTALGFACGFVLVPGVALQLRSTYVDLGFATFVAAALAFVCKKDLRAWDLWMAGVAIGLVGASKVTGFVIAPLIGLVGIGAVIARARRAKQPMLFAHALGAIAVVAALAGPTYLRNWLAHENPLWPGRVRVEALGVDWEGPLDITDMNVPTEQALEWFFGPPRPGEQHHDTKDNGYGNVPPFVIPPLALAGILVALAHLARGPDRRRALLLLAVTLPLIATFALTPARHWTRLNFHVVIAAFLLAAFAADRARRRIFGEGLSAALIVGGLITLWWSEPAWDVDLDRMRRLASLSAAERAVQRDEVFTLMPTETARARERELGRGDLVVFESVDWAGLLFNERFDNRVEHVDPRAFAGAEWLREAERRGAAWAVVRGESPLARQLEDSRAWERVGPADVTGRPRVAFRRTSER